MLCILLVLVLYALCLCCSMEMLEEESCTASAIMTAKIHPPTPSQTTATASTTTSSSSTASQRPDQRTLSTSCSCCRRKTTSRTRDTGVLSRAGCARGCRSGRSGSSRPWRRDRCHTTGTCTLSTSESLAAKILYILPWSGIRLLNLSQGDKNII